MFYWRSDCVITTLFWGLFSTSKVRSQFDPHLWNYYSLIVPGQKNINISIGQPLYNFCHYMKSSGIESYHTKSSGNPTIVCWLEMFNWSVFSPLPRFLDFGPWSNPLKDNCTFQGRRSDWEWGSLSSEAQRWSSGPRLLKWAMDDFIRNNV